MKTSYIIQLAALRDSSPGSLTIEKRSVVISGIPDYSPHFLLGQLDPKKGYPFTKSKRDALRFDSIESAQIESVALVAHLGCVASRVTVKTVQGK